MTTTYSKDPTWQRANRQWRAGIKALLTDAGIPPTAAKGEAAHYKARLHPECASSTQVPPLVLLKRVAMLLADLEHEDLYSRWLERMRNEDPKPLEEPAPIMRGYVVRALARRIHAHRGQSNTTDRAHRAEVEAVLDAHYPSCQFIEHHDVDYIAEVLLGLPSTLAELHAQFVAASVAPPAPVTAPTPMKRSMRTPDRTADNGPQLPVQPDPSDYRRGYADPAYKTAMGRWMNAVDAQRRGNTFSNNTNTPSRRAA